MSARPTAAWFRQHLGYGRVDAIVVVARIPYAWRNGDLSCDGRVNFYEINPIAQDSVESGRESAINVRHAKIRRELA